jgi:hypothetical protein
MSAHLADIHRLMTLVATWRSDGTHATLRDDADGLWATLKLVDDWYMPGSREPVRAWIIEWLDRREEVPKMTRTRLDIPEEPAPDKDTMARLSEAGAAAARMTAPAEPKPFGQAETGLGRGIEIHGRIELISHAIQKAQGRLGDAARVIEPWGGQLVLIALTEAVGWVRALDDAMNHVWRGLSDELRADITARIDEALDRSGWDPNFVKWARAQRDDTGYSDWTLGLLVRSTGLPREDLRGMRWLAGKMLHFGPLPAVQLKQWREGESPRWKWRPSKEIFPASRRERESHDRLAYDRYLAGHDLVGTFNFFNALLATDFLAWDLTVRPER